MAWKDKVKEWGPSDILFLSTDGASTNFIVVGDPVTLKGKFKGKEQIRVGCPVVTKEGFQLFVVGKRTARKLASVEESFKDSVINVTRHGVEGDTEATYEVTVLKDADTFKSLKAKAAKTYNADTLAEAIGDAKDVIDR